MGNAEATLPPHRLEPVPRHLVVFVHGLSGKGPAHGQFLKASLAKTFNPQDLQVYVCTSNSIEGSYYGSWLRTASGVRKCADRILHEVVSLLESNPGVQKISFIGASLGGLIARVVIADLYGGVTAAEQKTGVYKSKDGQLLPAPGLFATLASPHLGVRGLYSHWFGQYAVGWLQSGADMMLHNGLLLSLSCPDSPALRALSLFQPKILFAPLQDDAIVSHPTSAIDTHSSCFGPLNPFQDGPLSDNAQYIVRDSSVCWKDDKRIVSESKSTCEEKDAADKLKAAAHPFCNSDSKLQDIAEMERGLLSVGPWRVVDVHATHHTLATLPAKQPASIAVVDIIAEVLQSIASFDQQ